MTTGIYPLLNNKHLCFKMASFSTLNAIIQIVDQNELGDSLWAHLHSVGAFWKYIPSRILLVTSTNTTLVPALLSHTGSVETNT